MLANCNACQKLRIHKAMNDEAHICLHASLRLRLQRKVMAHKCDAITAAKNIAAGNIEQQHLMLNGNSILPLHLILQRIQGYAKHIG